MFCRYILRGKYSSRKTGTIDVLQETVEGETLLNRDVFNSESIRTNIGLISFKCLEYQTYFYFEN